MDVPYTFNSAIYRRYTELLTLVPDRPSLMTLLERLSTEDQREILENLRETVLLLNKVNRTT